MEILFLGVVALLAFANGDRRSLRDLLSSEVYESFDAAIKDREKNEQKTETRFVSIDKAELVGAELRDKTAQLTVRFVSQMISVTRDKAGNIVDGHAIAVLEQTPDLVRTIDPLSGRVDRAPESMVGHWGGRGVHCRVSD